MNKNRRQVQFSWGFPGKFPVEKMWTFSSHAKGRMRVITSSGEYLRLLQCSLCYLKSSFLEVFLEFFWLWKMENLQNADFLRDDNNRVHRVVRESTRLLQSAQKFENEIFEAIWRKTNVEVQKSKIRKVVESVPSTCGVTPEPVRGRRKRCWGP